MRVNPNYMPDLLAALNQSQLDAQRALMQLASGSRISQPSDDPAAAAMLVANNDQAPFTNVGFYESGLAQMKATSQPAFDRIASLLRRRNYRLRIEGHTDDVPIHTVQFSSNWELSTARATEIVRLFIVRDGFAPDRLSGAGYAEYHPIASNRTAQGRGMNRRVDIVILGRALPAIADSRTQSSPSAGSQ